MTYFTQVEQGFYPNSKDNVYNSLFRQYERILFESLITSFGLDIFIQIIYASKKYPIYP